MERLRDWLGECEQEPMRRWISRNFTDEDVKNVPSCERKHMLGDTDIWFETGPSVLRVNGRTRAMDWQRANGDTVTGKVKNERAAITGPQAQAKVSKIRFGAQRRQKWNCRFMEHRCTYMRHKIRTLIAVPFLLRRSLCTSQGRSRQPSTTPFSHSICDLFA